MLFWRSRLTFFVSSIGRSGYSVFVVVVFRCACVFLLFLLGGAAGEGDRFSVRRMCLFSCVLSVAWRGGVCVCGEGGGRGWRNGGNDKGRGEGKKQ